MYKTGLVLSGGGLRGFAHLGAIEAMYEQNIYPDIISGVSAGAIVGVFLAAGFSPSETLSFLVEGKFMDYVKFSIPRTGVFEMDGIRKLLNNKIKVNRGVKNSFGCLCHESE